MITISVETAKRIVRTLQALLVDEADDVRNANNRRFAKKLINTITRKIDDETKRKRNNT